MNATPMYLSSQTRVYRVAERTFAIFPAVRELEPFAGGDRYEPVAAAGGGPWQRIFAGEAPLGLGRRTVDCRWRPDGYRLEVGGVGRFAVTADGHSVTGVGLSADAEGLAETLLGPALILGLALRGVFCLHAGAVAVDGGVVAFLGDSGAGKSTLARALPALSPAYGRVADDILPVTVEAGTARVLARFPQLKCPPDAQPGLAAPPSLPLAALCVLDPGAPAAGVRPLSGCEAVLALVRHTVATRLFTPELLRRHTELCARLAEGVGVGRLHYPHAPEAPSQVAKALRRLVRNPDRNLAGVESASERAEEARDVLT